MAASRYPWRALAELSLAIASEQLATAALMAASTSISPLFLALSVSGYVSAIVWFGRSLRVLPMGLAYGL
jgi:multidrug transporter EmrE-like cation transporter